MKSTMRHPASFRDPSGYVFRQGDNYYRFVNKSYQQHYDNLMHSGLYQHLSTSGLLVKHDDLTEDFQASGDCYKILRPQQISFWTYPYEWSFEQLRQAALATLQINLQALKRGMILKDATAYNIQFCGGKPVLIDTLSFEVYEEGKPWQAFRQFCEHFLNPLLLHSKIDDFNPAILMNYPDGIPAKFTSSLLPRTEKLNLNNWLYLYLPAKLADSKKGSKELNISRKSIEQNLTQLSTYIKKLKHESHKSTWSHYYSETILGDAYLLSKSGAVERIIAALKPTTTIDIGSNTGHFSKMAALHSQHVISMDTDPLCVDKLFLETHKTSNHFSNITAIFADICNPTPATGWGNKERASLYSRLKGDLVLALAVIHHLALTKNVPLEFIIDALAELSTNHLVVEFVHKEDPKAKELLQSKADIFPNYTPEHFETLLQKHFTIVSKTKLEYCVRTLYHLKKK